MLGAAAEDKPKLPPFLAALIAHCAVLKDAIERGKIDLNDIDFEEAAKSIPLPIR